MRHLLLATALGAVGLLMQPPACAQEEPAEDFASPEEVVLLESPEEMEEEAAEREELEEFTPTPPPAAPERVLQPLTAGPASGAALWLSVWAEGPAGHRAQMASLENTSAPPLQVARWVRDRAAELPSSPEAITVLTFWSAANANTVEIMRDLMMWVRERDGYGMQVITVHSDECSEELSAALDRIPGNLVVGIDSGETVRAYRVDSFPDHYLLAGRTIVCADVDSRHLKPALDAVLSGWRPWIPSVPPAPASPEAAAASPEVVASAGSPEVED